MPTTKKEHVHDCNSELALASKNIKSKYWCKSIKLLLFLHNLDIFAIYKTKAEHSNVELSRKTDRGNDKMSASAPEACVGSMGSFGGMTEGMYRQKELKMANTCDDLRRHRWTLPIRMFILYMLVKASIITLAQYSLIKHKVLVPRRYSSPWLSVGAAETISRYLGNPLSELYDISLIAYFGPPFFSTLWLILFPRYLRKHSLDVAPLRFLFEPCHELKRIDLSVEQCFSDVKMSLEMYMSEKMRNLVDEWKEGRQNSQSGSGSGCIMADKCSLCKLDNCIDLEQVYFIKVDKLLTELVTHGRSTLRPATYSIEHYLSATNKMAALVVGAQLQYGAIWLISTIAAVSFVYKTNCGEFMRTAKFQSNYNWSLTSPTTSSLTNCKPLLIFSLPELIDLIELSVAFLFGCIIVTVNMILTFTVNRNQAKLISSNQLELRKCKQKLSQHYKLLELSSKQAKCNNTIGKSQAGSCPLRSPLHSHSLQYLLASSLQSARLKPHSIVGQGSKSTFNCASSCNSTIGLDDSQQMSSIDGRLKLDNCLLESLLKMMVCDQEMVNNSRCLSVLTLQIFYHLITTTLYAALAYCAHLHSRIIKLQRIMWTLLAATAKILDDTRQLYERDNRDRDYRVDNKYGHRDTHHSDQVFFDTFAAQLWRKFGLASSSSIERYCVRPFGFKFTYETIIKANFFFISIYFLAIGHR